MQGFAYFKYNVYSKQRIFIRTAMLYNIKEQWTNYGKTLSDNMSRKVHLKGRQRSEFQI